jgi:hypothetical protein
MALITYYVNVTVTKEGTLVAVTGLGTPMFLTTHSVTVNRSDTYSTLDEMETDGWTSIDEGHKWATALLSQDTVPDQFVIGKIEVGDANITASINAVQADNDTWYFVNIESRADQDITDIALWTEAQKKFFIGQTADPDIPTATAPNLATVLKALLYKRTALLYHALDAEYADGAWTGRCGSFDLDGEGGVGTWANKSLSGVTVNDLTTTAIGNIRTQGANAYHVVTTVNNVTTPGQAIIGTEFIDTQTTLDWLFFRITEEEFATLIGPSTKVPFTQAGIDLFEAALRTVLDRGVTVGHLAPDSDATPIATSAPKLSAVSAADKAARILRDLRGSAFLSGAIHQVIVTVKVSA